VVRQFSDQFVVADPRPLTQRRDQPTNDSFEGFGLFNAQDSAASVLEPVGWKTTFQRIGD